MVYISGFFDKQNFGFIKYLVARISYNFYILVDYKLINYILSYLVVYRRLSDIILYSLPKQIKFLTSNK